MTAPRVVCVTGASGFIASHLVKQLLEKGHAVRGTVRDASDLGKTAHLRSLPGSDRLTLFSAELTGAPGRFDEALAGVDTVFHTATPLVMGASDGKTQILEPAMVGTEELLAAIERLDTVKCFVLTSSMSAVAPKPEPEVKTEEHWSDDAAQEANGNWYGCTKTRQEKLCASRLAGSAIRHVAICPTGVFGPMLQPGVNTTNGWVAGMAKTGPKDGVAANDSMSFIDVRDCAAMHVAAMEVETARGRFMSVAGTPTAGKTASGKTVYASTHWNDIYAILHELHPAMPAWTPCDAPLARPTQFDLSKSEALLPQAEMRDVRTVLRDAVEALKLKAAL